MARKLHRRRRGSPPARGSIASRALIRSAQSPGIYYALPLLRDFADNDPLTTYRGPERCPSSISRDQASDVLHTADQYSCSSENDDTTWQLPYRPDLAIEALNANPSTKTSPAKTSKTMPPPKRIGEIAYHSARRIRMTSNESRRATSSSLPIDLEAADEDLPPEHQVKRQRTDQKHLAIVRHANIAVNTGARLSDNFRSSVRTYGLANESIAEQAERVSQDVNQLFGRTGDLLQAAQGRVAALEQTLINKVKEVDGLRAQVVRLTADIEVEKMTAKRSEHGAKNHDKIIAAAKALVASDFRDMGSRMQELAEAVQSGA
ncbi:hypothetical protein AC579_5505 [Pseudocercospora musae]|uniref:Uncharacterized protein n=1 Tax=Pseudocercospora musae TaxID=113226 RepID=A0A139IM65_9PEZI|nr:hypothetical protein AC579_5505 [Pseudocercospora musae]